MRIDLKVPFSEKDEAKKLGAKWDAPAKTWYVMNVTDLWPFMKWMPEHLRSHSGAAASLAKTKPKIRQVKSKKAYEKAIKRLEAKNAHFIAGLTTPRTDFSLKDTGCSCVPWDWCEHNPDPANLKTVFVYPTKPEHSFELAPAHLAHIRSILSE